MSTSVDDIVAAALVGTARGAAPLPAVAGALGESMRALPDGANEAKLLGAVALLSAFDRCGRRPATDVTPPSEAAAEEARPACTARATQILAMLLANPLSPTNGKLLGEWLAYAAAAGRRVSYRLLPALLDFAAGRKAVRADVVRVIGARGEWLLKQNLRWNFAASAEGDPAAVWQTGNREQRVSVLGSLRASEPARAQELVQSSWAEDAAEDRAAFVQTLTTGLSDADEPFLESALDDRSKQVRGVAADLLMRLPRSPLVARMTARADAMVSLDVDPTSRKAKPSAIQVTLPAAEFDKALLRDGVLEKPADRTGARQWWLLQIVSAVPPRHWSTKWGKTPAECVAAATNEFGPLLLWAWNEAAARNPDEAWVRALLLAPRNGTGTRRFDLLNALSPAAQQQITADVLEAPDTTWEVVYELLNTAKFDLDRRCTAAVMGQVERRLAAQKGRYDYVVAQLLDPLALRVPPETHDELAARCVGEAWEQNRKPLDTFLATLSLRRDLAREFQS